MSAVHSPTSSTTDLKVIWRGFVEAQADDSLSEEVQTSGKGSRGRCTRRTPPPWPLRKIAFEAWYPPGHLPRPVLPTNFTPAGARARTTSRGCEGVRNSSRKAQAGKRHNSRHLAANSRFYQSWSWPSLHNHVRMAGYKDSDIICVRGYLWRRRTIKCSVAHGRTCLPVLKPSNEMTSNCTSCIVLPDSSHESESVSMYMLHDLFMIVLASILSSKQGKF